MFVMMEYIPFTCYQYIILPGKRKNAFTWAAYLLFHMHFSQILHTISISLTVTLAVWRYIAIKHPHGRFASCILGRTGNAIFACFIISPLLCFPTYFVFSIDETIDSHAHTTLYHVNADADSALYSFNFWVHSIIIKLLPCCILTIISCILIEVLYTASKRRVKLKSYGNAMPSNGVPCTNGPLMERKPPRTNRRTDRTTMLLVAVLILFLITEFPQGILGLMSAVLDQCFFKKCYTLFGEFMDLLALINGAIGFVLYGLMSKQFRTTFKSLFLKKNVDNLELTRVTGTTSCG
ncbi:G-protein coupled receptor dmsr-1 [Culicoides brevitarsis]|uniref:G-protein coupled receptor dmsr-1 n=1 Tax=Culicoides brevitarsis TaxID=469753 RepID=UPI00307B8686